ARPRPRPSRGVRPVQGRGDLAALAQGAAPRPLGRPRRRRLRRTAVPRPPHPPAVPARVRRASRRRRAARVAAVPRREPGGPSRPAAPIIRPPRPRPGRGARARRPRRRAHGRRSRPSPAPLPRRGRRDPVPRARRGLLRGRRTPGGAVRHARLRPFRRRARADRRRRAAHRPPDRPAHRPLAAGPGRARTVTARAVFGRGRRRAVLACGLAGALVLGMALAREPGASARDVRSDPAAVALLRGAADAASRHPYQGRRFLTTAGRGHVVTSRASVAHTPGGGIRYRSETAGKGYRPESAAVETTGFTPETLALLTRNYSVVRAEDAWACGRRARVVEARRADGSPAGRFWIDAETGLMLHRELIDATGRPVVISGFSEISFTEPPPEPPAPRHRNGTARAPGGEPAEAAAAPWSDELDRADLDELRDRGWPVPEDLP